MKKSVNPDEFSKVFPSGVCQMGDTEVTYYRLSGNRLWFDKKAIELVLTGKNQHNLLGQYKDPKNHSRIFDTNRNEVIEIISKTGVHNYLKKAWSVTEESRYSFYSGIKTIENPREAKVTEPLQIPMFKIEQPKKEVNPYVKIVQDDDEMKVYSSIAGRNSSEKNANIVQMLLTVAREIMAGNVEIMTKEAA